jgi:hypothetical protein
MGEMQNLIGAETLLPGFWMFALRIPATTLALLAQSSFTYSLTFYKEIKFRFDGLVSFVGAFHGNLPHVKNFGDQVTLW